MVNPHRRSCVRTGREIGVTVSRGQEPITMADLTELDLQRARQIIERGGMRIGNLATQYHDTIPRGYICGQYPEPGQSFQRNEPITLIVSLGPQLSDLPSEPAQLPPPPPRRSPTDDTTSSSPLSHAIDRYTRSRRWFLAPCMCAWPFRLTAVTKKCVSWCAIAMESTLCTATCMQPVTSSTKTCRSLDARYHSYRARLCGRHSAARATRLKPRDEH
jgi:hypothetical protein